ncbi:hypothetical protein ACLGIH_04645 [Streptomyces sp. HMX87]|uniref:hypothetical protein n=1 Tax=Streptomyces sp. HMX87 TaxID=3390849 RepID=UPI003A8A1A06
MSRRPAHPVRVLASALAAGALLTTAACSGGARDSSGTTRADASPAAERAEAAGRQTTSPSPGTLTEDGARAALLTEADLEDDWQHVDDAATWRDRMVVAEVDVSEFLSAEADAADCQRLLDSLYSDALLGKPSGPSAVTGFQQGDSRLFEQIAAYDRGKLDDSLTWLDQLPVKCDEFTATGSDGEKRTVQVTEASVPDVGDAREGVHVTVQGPAAGNPAELSLNLSAVRVGSSAMTLTVGGLSGDERATFDRATKLGAQRLQEVMAGRTPDADPTGLY